MAHKGKAALLGAALTLFCHPSWAVNKCTSPSGQIAYQDAPCSNASKTVEKVKTWDAKLSSGHQSSAGLPAINPDLNLKGPAQAKPLLDLYRRWADAERLALATSRIALSGPIAAMQAIQREAESLSGPDCLSEARKALVELTQKSSQGMLEFLGKEALEGMVYTVVYRRELVPAFETAIKKAKCE